MLINLTFNVLDEVLSFFLFFFSPGELLVMEYLYSQNGKERTPVLQNPEEEVRLVVEVNDEDFQNGGFVEESMEDIAVPVLYEDDPSRALQSRPSLLTSPQASPPPPSPPQPTSPPPSSHLPSPTPSSTPQAPASTAYVPSSSMSDEAEVRHFNNYFNPISMTFYFTYITINQFIREQRLDWMGLLGWTRSRISVRLLTSLTCR